MGCAGTAGMKLTNGSFTDREYTLEAIFQVLEKHLASIRESAVTQLRRRDVDVYLGTMSGAEDEAFWDASAGLYYYQNLIKVVDYLVQSLDFTEGNPLLSSPNQLPKEYYHKLCDLALLEQHAYDPCFARFLRTAEIHYDCRFNPADATPAMLEMAAKFDNEESIKALVARNLKAAPQTALE